MKGVAIVQEKGGVGKTTLCHLLALGATHYKQQTFLMHTDNRQPIKVIDRPYRYFDGRQPRELASIIKGLIQTDGLCVIDSGGNRPEFDQWIANSVDLVIIPIVPDEEAVFLGLAYMKRLQANGHNNIRFLLNNVSSNRHEKTRDQKQYFDLIPIDLIMGKVGKVAAVKQLRDSDKQPFKLPPSKVNSLSRKLYKLVRSELEYIA